MLRRAALVASGLAIGFGLASGCGTLDGGSGPEAFDAAADGTSEPPPPLPDGAPAADADGDVACAYDCGGGACLGGVCQPVVIASGLERPYALAVDDQAAYFTELGPDTGIAGRLLGCEGPPPCTPQEIVAALENPRAVAVTADAVFVSQWWAARTNPGNAIYGFKRIDRSMLASFPYGAYGARGLASTSDKAWFCDLGSANANGNGDGNVARMKQAAGTYLFDGYVVSQRRPLLVAVIPTGDGGVREFFTADNSLYEAGNANSVATAEFVDLASDGKTLFWIDKQSGNAKVFTCGTGCANAFVAELATAPTASGIAADDTGIYWVEEGATPKSGRVRRLAKGASTPTTLLDGVARPQRIALTATSIFLTVLGDGATTAGALLRLAKP